MIEGTDYCFIYPKEDTSIVHIKLLNGPYKDTIYKYGKVKFEEKNDNMYLQFAYYVLESPISKPKKLEKDEDFKNYVGNFLVEMMSNNLDMDIIDETGTDDNKKPHLQ